MYILIISRGTPSPKSPMWGNFEWDQARALRRAGHKVVVLSVDRRVRFYWRKPGFSHSVREGIDICNYFIPLPYYHMTDIRTFLKIDRKIMDHCYKKIEKMFGRPDIVHAHYQINITSAGILKEKYNLPFIGTEHWSELNKATLITAAKKMGKIAYAATDKNIAVSQSLYRSIQKHFGVCCDVISNMYDSQIFNIDFTGEKPKENFVFCAVGRLAPQKGFDTLIDSFCSARLPENVILNIIGEGNCRRQLQKAIDEYGLGQRIKLLGFKTRSEIAEEFRKSSAFVLSSKYETFGVVCIEAMAMGLPVVATACGGPEEFITPDTGIVVAPASVAEFAGGLRKMYDRRNEFDKNHISRYARENFSPEKIASRLEDLYSEVLTA